MDRLLAIDIDDEIYVELLESAILSAWCPKAELVVAKLAEEEGIDSIAKFKKTLKPGIKIGTMKIGHKLIDMTYEESIDYITKANPNDQWKKIIPTGNIPMRFRSEGNFIDSAILHIPVYYSGSNEVKIKQKAMIAASAERATALTSANMDPDEYKRHLAAWFTK